MGSSSELGFESKKQYSFSQMADVQFDSVTVYDKGSHLAFKHKFNFTVQERVYECYARTDIEMKLWVQTLSRVLDCNQGIAPEVSGVRSKHY